MTDFTEWGVDETDLTEMNPERARDIILDYYLTALKDNRPEEFQGLPTEEQNKFEEILTEVKTLFEVLGGSYSEPDRKIIPKVIDGILDKVKSLGVPEEVMHHHRLEMQKIIKVL